MASTSPACTNCEVRLSILVPVFNEKRTVRKLLSTVLSVDMGVAFEVIVVDDCSTDGSDTIIAELAKSDPRIRLLRHETNRGKGAAIQTAIKCASGDITIVQDADLEYDPSEIPKVIRPILDGRADAVFGSRFAGSECRRVLYYWHTVGNQFLTWLTNIVADINLTDMETCYKAVRTEILKQIPLRCNRFGIEPELTLRLSQWGARIYEVPISYFGRTYAEGKKITWKDGFRALVAIVWTGLIDRRFTTHDGFYVLTSVRGSGLNKWMYSLFSRYVGQRVLEAGCGVGNLTSYMLDREDLICADIDPIYLRAISQRFGHLDNFRCINMDLSKQEDFTHVESQSLDSVICLNVLEHIEDDDTVLNNFFNALKPGGYATILVPQYQYLFSPVDFAVGHFRRYDRRTLHQKIERAGFKIVHAQGFNRLGTFGWWLNGKVLKKDTLSPKAMAAFNALLPLAKFVERLSMLPALSLIVVGQKPQTPDSCSTAEPTSRQSYQMAEL